MHGDTATAKIDTDICLVCFVVACECKTQRSDARGDYEKRYQTLERFFDSMASTLPVPNNFLFVSGMGDGGGVREELPGFCCVRKLLF